MGEFDVIARFVRAFRPKSSPRGPGDDCAVIPSSKNEWCVTTDAVVEDVHFTLKTFSFEDVGHKALAVNLSDLAAMGAAPKWFVCALGLPKSLPPSAVDALARGMASLARAHKLELVGGNVTSAHQLSVTLTVAGEVSSGRALLRGGARPGDVLYVSGLLGDARWGLALLSEGVRSGSAVTRQRRPSPRVGLGLLARAYASGAIDVSDGFAQDLQHLCTGSKVGAQVDVLSLPLSRTLQRAHGSSAWEWALAGGEDYELILSVPPGRAAPFEKACARAGHKVTPVGRLTRQRAVRFLLEGADVRPPPGFDHL